MQYQEKKFDLPQLADISTESVEQHLSLYAGYVKNFNALMAAQAELMKDSAQHAHALSEVTRRLFFEFDGMRLHEHYFAQWERGATPLMKGSGLEAALARQYGSADACMQQVKQVGLMRGVGWSLLYFDPLAGLFHIGFSEQQHQGHFATLPVVLALDVWEHAYVAQWGVAGRGAYIDAFFKNLNWEVCETRFAALQK